MSGPVFYDHPFLGLKLKLEESKIEIVDQRNNSRLVNSFFIEVEKMKIEKLNTARFLAECMIGRRLKKNEVIAFRDGNETNFDMNNFQIVPLIQENNISYIAINLDEEEKNVDYKSIASISRALGIRGVIIKGCIEGLVDKVKSPKTNKLYRFEKRIIAI